MLRGVAAAGFHESRPVQRGAIPAALEGRDVLGLAQTGTGKTAAFLLPIFTRLMRQRRHGPRALIVAPTRELASQIHAEAELLARFTPLRFALIFGGVPAFRQKQALARHPDVLVACPGRLLDLWQQRAVDLSKIEVLVLDEADQMFDMGFLPSIQRILSALPRERQNMLFSATMPRQIRVLADRLLRDPQVVELSHSAPPATIDHGMFNVLQEEKVGLLERLIAGDDFTSGMVFLRTKHRARRLAQQLIRSGHRAVSLQGNMSQSQRERAMNGFREGRFNVLVATDIAARGIDVAKVSHVINFDVPNTPDAYTHRVGRTGRSECSGRAYTFVCREDRSALKEIERKTGLRIPRLDSDDARSASPLPVDPRERAPQSIRPGNRAKAHRTRGGFPGSRGGSRPARRSFGNGHARGRRTGSSG